MRTTIDVRVLAPKEKHPTIIQTLQNAGDGEIVEIINDHDPIPLFYQLQALFHSGINWNYLSNGPDVWQVEISKKEAAVLLVKDAVKNNPNAISVFRKFGIDYCCNGKMPLKEACARVGVFYDLVMKELDALETTELASNLRANKWPLGLLIDYIVYNHHAFVKEATPEILFFLTKVENAHGSTNPEIAQIKALFTELSAELTQHMAKEEEVLFPTIKQLVHNAETLPIDAECSAVENAMLLNAPINCMEAEHEEAGEILVKISRLTHKYSPPANACNSFQHLYRMLKAYEEDLHQHIHLENNILFEKAKELESGSLVV